MKIESLNPTHIIENIKVDKVILMDVIMLLMYSILAIFSSTSKLVMRNGGTRLGLFAEQWLFVLLSIGLIILICRMFNSIKPIRLLSKTGFFLSMFFLLMLILPTDRIPGIHRVLANGEYRSVKVFFFNVQSSEVVKICMVAYLAWAVHALKNGGLKMADRLQESFPIFKKESVRALVYVGIPMGLVAVLSLKTGSTNGIFITVIMFASILIGGFKKKFVIQYLVLGVVLIGGAYAVNQISGGKVLDELFGRFNSTGKGRIYRWITPIETQIAQRDASESMREIIDENEHLKGLVAIHEGGIFGKGPGNSTQKYEMFNMFSDYVYAFLCEEYGILLAGLPILFIFITILSRGAIIARNCENLFARVIVSGYSVLISGQGLLHIAVNCGLLPTTGQTLPLVSDGKGSVLMFSIAFGVLLFISKEAQKNIARQEAKANALFVQSERERYSEYEDIIQESEELTYEEDQGNN